jgi:hypothetical protein
VESLPEIKQHTKIQFSYPPKNQYIPKTLTIGEDIENKVPNKIAMEQFDLFFFQEN